MSSCSFHDPGGIDYDAIQDYPLVLLRGSVAGDLVCTNISISDDTILEYNETFTISLSTESRDNVVVNSSVATVTIKDDDCE